MNYISINIIINRERERDLHSINIYNNLTLFAKILVKFSPRETSFEQLYL